MDIGGFEVASVVTGTIALDGGAMYGVVPKVLWSRFEEPDELNRIRIAMRSLVAVNLDRGDVIVVDGGAGEKWPHDELERYSIEVRQGAVEEALRSFRLAPGDVTDVVITHGHFDHAGGFSRLDSDNVSSPLFPNARHWIHKGHWDHLRNPTERDRASFLRRDFVFLEDSGLLHAVEGEEPRSSIEGVEWFVSHGHTPFMLLPVFKGSKRTLMFTGDLIPLSTQINPAWNMSYDLLPLVILEERKKVLKRAADQEMVLAFPHDMKMAGATVRWDGRRYVVREEFSF